MKRKLKLASSLILLCYMASFLFSSRAYADESKDYIEINSFGQIFQETDTKIDFGKLFISIDSKACVNLLENTQATIIGTSNRELTIERLGKKIKIKNDVNDSSYVNLAELAEQCACFYIFDSANRKCSIAPRISAVELKNDAIKLKSDNPISHAVLEASSSGGYGTISIKGAFIIRSVKMPATPPFKNAVINSQVKNNETISELSMKNVIFSPLEQTDDYEIQIKMTLTEPNEDSPTGEAPTASEVKIKTIEIPKADSLKSKVIAIPKPGSKSQPQTTSDLRRQTIIPRQISFTDLQVTSSENSLEIKLTFSEPFTYKWLRFKVPDNRFLFEIPRCKMTLATKEFPINGEIADKIRVAQYEPGPSGSSRAVVDLKIPAKFELIKNGETSVILKFSNVADNPSSMVMSGYGMSSNKAVSYNPDGISICIDPGHGGGDHGAMNAELGLSEKHITLEISLILCELLRSKGFNVIMTRTSDRDVTYAGSPDYEELGARVDAGKNSDLFISVHINASSNKNANGISVHWSKSIDEELAQDIQFSLIAKTERRDRGAIKDNLYVTKQSAVPAALVEAGFISNNDEALLFKDKKYLKTLAEAICEGIEIYLSKNPKKDMSDI